MRDSLGGAVNIIIIVVFIVIALGYMAFNVNYTKAFRMKNKIISVNKEGEYLYKKYVKEVKVLESKKKYNLKNTRSVDILKDKIENNMNIVEYETNKLREEDINETQVFEKKMSSILEKIYSLKNEIKDINKIKNDLKLNYNEEIGLLKSTYETTFQREESNKLSIVALKNELIQKNKIYEQKLDYLEKLKSSPKLNMKKKNGDLQSIRNKKFSIKI